MDPTPQLIFQCVEREVKMVPIGRLLRQKKRPRDATEPTDNDGDAGSMGKPVAKAVKLSDLDSMINNLEAGGESDDDSDSDSDSSSSSSSGSRNHSKGSGCHDNTDVLVEKDEDGNILKFVSSNMDDVIAPLPKSMLPLPKPKAKPTDRENKLKSSSGKDKVVKFVFEGIGEVGKSSSKNPADMSKEQQNGLEKTIREMLKNYEPASHEKRPFWCRICRYQGENLDDWKAHNSTSEHKLAEDIERRVSYCRICKKQFTSPDQLKEHNKGKPHKQALTNLKEKQARAKKFS
jgi:hypothetical protein